MADKSKPKAATEPVYVCSKGHVGSPYIGTDGFRRCRECKREHRRGWIKKNPEQQKKTNQYVKNWRAKHPERRQAQVDAQHAKATIKGSYCEACLNETDLEMHHPDYSKPLEVLTLCKSCHEGVHHVKQ